MKFPKTIAIDYDGTIVNEGTYPNIGEPKPNAIHTMKRILENGWRIIIWTSRGDEGQLKGIRESLESYGITGFKINEQFDDALSYWTDSSPKVFADIYIDDRGIFTKQIDWYEIERILFPEGD